MVYTSYISVHNLTFQIPGNEGTTLLLFNASYPSAFMYHEVSLLYSVVFVLLQNSALWDASYRGDLEEVKSLVNKKADVNWRNAIWVSSIL